MILGSLARVKVALAPVDFRRGIDGLAALCKSVLVEDPFSGTVFAFRNRAGTSLKLLRYDGQGFWLCQKRLSTGRFRHWPSASMGDDTATSLLAHELHVLLRGGDPRKASGGPIWREVKGIL